jgi:hypothetical protein
MKPSVKRNLNGINGCYSESVRILNRPAHGDVVVDDAERVHGRAGGVPDAGVEALARVAGLFDRALGVGLAADGHAAQSGIVGLEAGQAPAVGAVVGRVTL